MSYFEEEEEMRFSWSVFFAVTGISLILFSFFVKLIDGEHVPFFLKTGFIALVLASIAYMLKQTNRRNAKKNARRKPSIFQND